MKLPWKSAKPETSTDVAIARIERMTGKKIKGKHREELKKALEAEE